MVRLQHLVNKKQKKEVYNIVVPIEIVKLLGLKKGQEFAVRFDEDKKEFGYVPLRK